MAKSFSKVSQVLGLLAALTFSILNCAYASYGIDGYLSDWGVNPFFNWSPWDGRVDYVEKDWGGNPPYPGYIGHGSMPGGGEKYDVEAMYFDDDPAFIYFAMVSSFPLKGRDGVASGDLALGFGGSGNFPFGLKLKGISSYGPTLVSLLKLRPGETWNYSSNPAAGPTFLGSGIGEEIGHAEIYYWNATSSSRPESERYTEPGTSFDTWVLEGRINRLLVNGLAGGEDMMRLHYAIACGNDWLNLTGDFDTPVIPEPASILLLGSGLIGLLGAKIKKGK